MILWTLRGYSDPDGEFQSGEVVCSLEKGNSGYRLLVEHAGEVQTDESHSSIDTARTKANALKRQLLEMGWKDS